MYIRQEVSYVLYAGKHVRMTGQIMMENVRHAVTNALIIGKAQVLFGLRAVSVQLLVTIRIVLV
jgi:hypothetical protein